MTKQKALLVILDGWGHGQKRNADAIAQSNVTFVNSLYQKYPNSELITHGEQVGLPDGQMGNSEVGHLNIGAGRIVYQELARINKSIKDKELEQNPILLDAIQYAKTNNKAIHLMGLLSDGGVHSHIEHLFAFINILQKHHIENSYVHAFMDGRDTDPKGGINYIQSTLDKCSGTNTKLASVIGRYYAMDRDKRWDRIKLAYDLMVSGKGVFSNNIISSIQSAYDKDETDEFLQPILLEKNGLIKEDDVLICFNFRTDRPREISTVLTQEDMPEFNMRKLNLEYVCTTRYDEKFKNIKVLFEKDNLFNTMGEILEKENRTQVRIAETEKYAHVTHFFSGGREKEFSGEKRILVPSPKVATYDLKPEMSCIEVTDEILTEIDQSQPDFICLNYANADMVGHTGVFSAAQKAVETVSQNLNRLIDKAIEHDYEAIIIADHGNSDFLINEDGSPNTAHSMNPVPCFYVSKNNSHKKIKDGKLADVAPTLLKIMGIEIPKEMTGEILIQD